MPTLYLLRHAKSSWEDSSLADFDRPLVPRGRKAARRLGRYLRERGLEPDLVLLSPAKRCEETWDVLRAELFQDSSVKGPEVRRLKSLYLAGPARLLARLASLPDDVAAPLLIGHNPGLERLATELAGAGSDRGALAELSCKYPTAALAIFHLPLARWRLLAAGSGRLSAFIRPRDLA